MDMNKLINTLTSNQKYCDICHSFDHNTGENGCRCWYCGQNDHNFDDCQLNKRNMRISSIYGFTNNGYSFNDAGLPLVERDFDDEEKQIRNANQILNMFKKNINLRKSKQQIITSLKKIDWSDINMEMYFPMFLTLRNSSEITTKSLKKIIREIKNISEFKMDKKFFQYGFCHLYDQETDKFYVTKCLPCTYCGTMLDINDECDVGIFGGLHCGCQDTPRNRY